MNYFICTDQGHVAIPMAYATYEEALEAMRQLEKWVFRPLHIKGVPRD